MSNIEETVSALLKLRNTKGMSEAYQTFYAASPKSVREAVDAKIAEEREGKVFSELQKRVWDSVGTDRVLAFQQELESLADSMTAIVKSDTQSRGRLATEYTVHAVTIETAKGTLKVVLTV